MKFRNFIIILIMAVLLFSCNKKKENNQETKQENLDETINKKVFSEEDEKERIKEIIYKNDEDFKKYNYKIIYIEKANFGIPGGDNWIVLISDYYIFIYAINDNRIEKRYIRTAFKLEKYSDFNIMQDIPGTHIDSSTSSFSDFNLNGKDEIFEYGFFGNVFRIYLSGYNEEENDFVEYNKKWIPFGLIDKVNGPAPIEFLTYKGMFGFKVYYFNPEVAGGEGWVSDPDPKNGKWIFYTWDTEKRTYIEIGKIIE